MPEPTSTPAPAAVVTPPAGTVTPPPAPPATAGTPGAAPVTAPTSTALTAEPTTTTEPGTAPGATGDQPKGETSTPPAELQIKLPEGVKLDTGLFDAFKPIAKDLGLKSEGAQKLVDLFVTAQQNAEKTRVEQHAERVTKWAEEARADKEIGNTNWDASVKAGQLALRKIGSPELAALLNETGLGNHKAVIGFFARVGKSLSEDSLSGTSAGAVPGQTPDLATLLYTHPTSPK